MGSGAKARKRITLDGVEYCLVPVPKAAVMLPKLPDGPKALAAEHWFGYGRWDAPFWFVGMEPGGDDDHASYEAWLALDPNMDGLIDCRAHHVASNVVADKTVTHWHVEGVPPIQRTWGSLIRTLLASNGEAPTETDIATYQRDEWGSLHGETAVIELSALHARNLGQNVPRTLFRSARIAEICRRLALKTRGFALFYGLTYETEFAEVAGDFGPAGCRWHGNTFCVLTVHPAYRYAPPSAYWVELGNWIRAAVDAGSEGVIPLRPPLPPTARTSGRQKSREMVLQAGEHPIVRDGIEVGRVVYDGWKMYVERKRDCGAFEPVGFYERSRPSQAARKLAEISDVFEDWTKQKLGAPETVKANWRAAVFVPDFYPPDDCISAGCAVVENDGIPLAYIYKKREGGARWVEVARP